MRRFLLLLPPILLLAGCGGGYGGGGSKASSGSAVKTVQIAEKEFSLTPSTISLSKTGTYAFKAMNNGTVAHALEIEGNGIEAKTGEIQPGSSATLQIALTKAGTYEMYCPIDGHKQQGMKGNVTVGGGGSSGGMTTNEGTTTSGGGGYGY